MKPSHRTAAVTVTTLLAATLLASTAAPALAAPAAAHPRPRSVDGAALQRALEQVTADGIPGAVAEVRDGNRAWSGAAGVEELGGTRRPSPDARFRIGSVTKTFVATVVLQLVAEKKIGLDDRIDRHLPGLIPTSEDENGRPIHYGDRITVRQLLHHTSGLANYTDSLFVSSGGDFDVLRTHHYTPPQLIGMALDMKADTEPGGAWAYSNTNYVVLGLLVERATGSTLGQEIDRRIVRPLRLENTSMPTTSRIAGRHLHGYERFPRPSDPLTDITEYDPDVFWGPGNMISTAHDLNVFSRALLDGRLLPAALGAEMRRLTPDDEVPQGRFYGLGLEGRTVFCADGSMMLGHTGSVPGYQTFTFSTPDGTRQATLALSSDTDITRNEKAAGDAVTFMGAALCGS
ncbi:MAG: beta-lactamase family protein [Streptomyces sp.]|jgi:D-alanyl-D-alanine carboxypeptidase|nr:beta-lactamase family protein [Streptomyces sp.]